MLEHVKRFKVQVIDDPAVLNGESEDLAAIG